MTLIKLAGLSILMTLAFQRTHTLGETFLPPENNKDAGLKTPDKRTNNFRVPMETTFDPNFWPARGRRSRRDPEADPQPENCVNSPLERCQQVPKIYEALSASRRSPDFEILPPIQPDDDQSLVEKPDEICYGTSLPSTKPRSAGRFGVKITEALAANMLTKGFDEFRRKKQRHPGLPQLILYGNGVYWEPDNLYGEKKKKQDVFWVARGKKNYNYPLK